MNTIDRAGYLAYARLPVFERVVARARENVKQALVLCERPSVSFSAGKDSSCVLALVLEQRPDVNARILTSGESRDMHPNLDRILGWWRERYPALWLEEELVDRVYSPEWQHAGFEEQRQAGHRDIQTLLVPRDRFDGFFVGLRADESWPRRVSISRGEVYRMASGLVRCAPIGLWKRNDVGAFLALHDLPLLDAYEHEGLDTRTTMRMTGKSILYGASPAKARRYSKAGFARLAVRFEELWGMT